MALDPVATGIASGMVFNRKARTYTDTVDIWRIPKTKRGPKGQVTDPVYALFLAGVATHRESAPNHNSPEILGQSDIDNVFTLDILHVDQSVQVRANDVVQFHSAGHHDDGQWFTVQGEAQVKNWRAGKQMFYIKQLTDPRFPNAAISVETAIDALAEGIGPGDVTIP